MGWMGTLGQGDRGSYHIEAWNKRFLFNPPPICGSFIKRHPSETAAKTAQQHTRACGCLAQEHLTTVPGCWQLLCCCQHPELLLESSLEQHPEVGAASRGGRGSCSAGPKPSDGALSNRDTYRKGHQAGDTCMGMRGKKRSLLGGEGARALLFPVQPCCLPLCTLMLPGLTPHRWGWLWPSEPGLCLSPVGLGGCGAKFR